jgi:hypothetical protein
MRSLLVFSALPVSLPLATSVKLKSDNGHQTQGAKDRRPLVLYTILHETSKRAGFLHWCV